jgi:branched-chain amino acid transport system ATP-binding protein
MRSTFIEQALGLPRARREAEAFRQQAQGVLEFLELQA